MFYADIVEESLKLNSYMALSDVLEGYTLIDEQCIDIVTALARKSGIICYETGLGKTLIASAIMKLLKRERNDRRFIFFAQKSQLIQTPEKIMKSCGLSLLTVTAENAQITRKLLNQDFSRYDVLMLTHGCLNSPEVMAILLQRAHLYSGVFIDEAHELSNFLTSSSGNMLRSMVHNFEYRYALTATPVTTSLSQLSNLCHIVERELIPDPKGFTKQLEYGMDVRQTLRGFLTFRDRRELGINVKKNGIPVYVKAMPHQAGASGQSMFKITKGEGAYAQIEALYNIILNERPNRGIVYINQHEVREFVENELYKRGVRFACINGKTSLDERKGIVKMFEQKMIDIIITSVTTSNDLACEYVICYEFTTDLQQLLGRAVRGMNPKDINVYFIFTTHTEEISYFMNNIYNRSLMIQDVLGQDYEMVVKMGQNLGM